MQGRVARVLLFDSDPMGHPLASFTASKSLVLRSASALDLQKCGLLKRGKRVVVLEESFKNKGVHRSRVALESDLGTPLGWVTRDKRGRELLKTMRSAEGELGFYTSLRSEYRGKKPCAFTARLPAPFSRKPNSSSSDSPEASNDCADSPNADSLASRVAGRRRDSIARRASRASTARASTRASVLSADSPLAPALKRQATRALPPELCHQSTATSIAAASLPRLSAIQLRRAARACVVRAEGLDQTFETFHSEFAKLLRQKQMTVDELLASWDRNGDGSISRQEFRINVRALGFRVSTREVDGLFECIDEDGGGELDLRELKVALRRLQADAAAVSAKTDAQRERAATLLGVGSKFETAASAASEYEASEALLQQLTHFPSLEKRIGDVLIKRNVKIGELVAKWGPPEALTHAARDRTPKPGLLSLGPTSAPPTRAPCSPPTPGCSGCPLG